VVASAGAVPTISVASTRSKRSPSSVSDGGDVERVDRGRVEAGQQHRAEL
jgi:hypothetical protein